MRWDRVEYGQTPGRDRPGLGRRSQQLQVQAEADAHTLAGCPNNHQPLLPPPCGLVLLQHHVVPSAHEADIGLLAVAVWQLWDSLQQTVGLGPIFALVMTGQPGLPGRAEWHRQTVTTRHWQSAHRDGGVNSQPGHSEQPHHTMRMGDSQNNNTQSIADYLAQLLKDKKQLAAFPNVFIHMERLLDDGEYRWGDKYRYMTTHHVSTDTKFIIIIINIFSKQRKKEFIIRSDQSRVAFMLSLRNFQQACLSFRVRQLGNKQILWAGPRVRCYHDTILPPIKRKRYAGVGGRVA